MHITFDIQDGIPLIAARGVFIAAQLSLVGTLAFAAFVAPKALAGVPVADQQRVGRPLRILAQVSCAGALVALLAWLVLQASNMADVPMPLQAIRAVPAVLSGTVFGHVIMGQCAGLLAAAALLVRPGGPLRQTAALVMAAAVTALQAGHGHATSMYDGPSILLLSDVVHLWAAGGWLGGLVPLLLVTRFASPRVGAMAARWFSPLGKLCVAAIVASAAFQGWVLVGSVPGLAGTAYGWMVLTKLVLLGALCVFAVLNRYRFAPALLQADGGVAQRVLVRSIAGQTCVGLGIIAAAVVLSSLSPSMHLQPVWPFPQMPSLDTVQEDPDVRNEVLLALLALAIAGGLLVAAAMMRHRVRWAAGVAALGVIWAAVPHLGLLFVPAYPTSFYQSPTNFAAASIVRGAALLPAHCAVCHGTEGRGDGPGAKGLPVPPADLTAAHLWGHSDGELFWWLSHGIEAPEGGLAMPGFAGTLSEDQRWALIDYIRAHNAGLAFQAAGHWSPPIQAPDFQAVCDGHREVSLSDLRGRFVRIIAGSMATGGRVPGVVTVLAGSDGAAHPGPGLCIGADETLAQAYAIAFGLSAHRVDGLQFLIDDHGVLRAVQQPPAKPGWDDPALLAAAVQALRAHPLAVQTSHMMDMPM
jgi:putative copper export protein/mono/diheme cytochrome c family protein